MYLSVGDGCSRGVRVCTLEVVSLLVAVFLSLVALKLGRVPRAPARPSVFAVAAPVAAILAVVARVAELLGAREVEPLYAHVCPLSVAAGLTVPVAVAIG